MSNTGEAFLKKFDSNYHKVVKLNESGSGRENYRFHTLDRSFIFTINENVEENETFFYLTELFKNLNGHVPQILQVSEDRKMYIQEDLGEQSLLQYRLDDPSSARPLYEETVKKLAHLQISSYALLDPQKLFDSVSFDDMLVYRDLFYFKNYFLDFLRITYRQAELLKEFELIAKKVKSTQYRYTMLRDFQGRNVMVEESKPYFIDYQDAMEGPIAYDLVSLLWQAKAQLNDEEKNHLFKVYADEVQKLLPNKFDLKKFKKDYEICCLIRLMQVMGAYGKLGLIQKKAHFKESLTFGMENLKAFTSQAIMQNFPILKDIFVDLEESKMNNISI